MTGPGQDDQQWTLEVETRPGATVITVAGELDMATAPQLTEALLAAVDRPRSAPFVVLDMSGIRFLASAGVSALVHATLHATEAGSAVRTVTGGSRLILRTLRISGADRVVDLYPTVEAALPGP